MKAYERIKKIDAVIITIAILVFLGSAVVKADTINATKTSYRGMKVIELDYDNNIVTVEDANGFIFEFFGCEDYFLNDIIICIIDNKGTKIILDDEIIDTVFSGFSLE